MPKLITEVRLREAVDQETFLKRGDHRSVEGIKVDLHLGDSVLKAKYGAPISLKGRTGTEAGAVQIEPSEVVFVLTREELALSASQMATLSPKRTLAHSGIVVLGGLAVDPGYRGVLWLGLYNVSTTPFALIEGRKLISAMFYELDAEEAEGVSVAQFSEPQREFPEQLIELIAKYKPVELSGLQSQLLDTKRDLEDLRREMRDDQTWQKEFRESLGQHNAQLGTLIKGLDAERDARLEGERDLKKELSTISGMFSGLKNWRTVSIIALTAIFTAILGWIVKAVLDSQAAKPNAQPSAQVYYYTPPQYQTQPPGAVPVPLPQSPPSRLPAQHP